MSKERDATSSEWDGIMNLVARSRAQAESDVAKYDADVKSGARRDVEEHEKIFRQAALDYATAQRILEELYKRQFPDPPVA